MKKISFKEIMTILNIHVDNVEDFMVEYVTHDIKKINHNTLVFHLNKDVELDVDKFDKLKNCFIITDQSILNSINHHINTFIFVTNVDLVYKQFIHYYRNLFTIPIVAITGTCGKTTTKEMITQVLSKKYKVVSTIGNKNALNYDNDYLMSIDEQVDFGVFETAISYPGNLIYGCEYFKPTIGIITTIGIDHLNGCKTIDNYIRTKSEMLAGLQYQGTLIINNDDVNIKKIALTPFKGKILTFGITEKSDFQAKNIAYSENGMTFTLVYHDQEYHVKIPGFGDHNVYNALASITALTTLGLNMDEIISELEQVKHIRSHLEFHRGINNSTIIDDTWSSNPTSMKAALKVLFDKGTDKVKIAVLGKISYLGEFASQFYTEIAKMLIEFQLDFLITGDSSAKIIGKNAVELGMDPNRFIHCKTHEELKTTLECLLDSNSIVLFKVSMLDQSLTGVMHELIINK